MHELLVNILTSWNRIRTYNPLVVGVELLLIGLVVWGVMRFLRGTRGVRLVKGAAVLLVGVYVVIRLLPKDLSWDRIELLYGKFLLFAFLALVVAFQPELRRALMALGQARLLGRGGGEMQQMVDELVQSAGYLSRNRVGAIMAIERNVGLGQVIETGTPIDGQVQAGLLNTIFHPGTPLHDMGVVIRNGRLAAAGCQFPLAESDEVDPSLGTRHRAALGLCQDTDAIVVVLSEETGRVSLAYDGQLYIGLDLDSLRQSLLNLLGEKGWLRKLRAKTA